MAKSIPKRSAIPVKHTWDTASIFPSDKAWEAEVKRVTEQLPNLLHFQGQLRQGSKILADWCNASEQVLYSLGKIFVYASMCHTVDMSDQEASAKYDRARGLYARTLSTIAFSEPEMLAIGFDTLRRWMSEEPRLALYKHYFDQLERRQAHVRSSEVEEILGQIVDPFGTASATHSLLADADLTFRPARGTARTARPVEVAQGTIGKLLTDPDRKVRRTAWESYADAHLAVKNAVANCLASGVKQNVFTSRVRRYRSALEAAITSNYIPTEVFHNLIQTYRKHLPTWHRYWAIRKRALGYKKLYVYDTRAPLTAKKPRVSFEQSMEWISEGLKPLGNEYVSIMRRGVLKQRWVDIYPNKGKRTGAFSTGVPGTHPFILMSYNDDLFSLSTLAHELGHSMHSYYTWKTQPFVYADYSIFVAEVASNFNQALVRAHLLEESDDPDFQIAVIEEAMANFHRYFFIMPTLARFELEIHERVERGEALAADSMIKLMADLFREGYGKKVEMDADRVGITWAQFHTHLYANFYVYQYATGISGAHALAEKILAGEPGAVENYLKFLNAGNSLYPLEVLKLAGVDLSSPEPVEKTFDVLARYVERLEKLVGRPRRRSK